MKETLKFNCFILIILSSVIVSCSTSETNQVSSSTDVIISQPEKYENPIINDEDPKNSQEQNLSTSLLHDGEIITIQNVSSIKPIGRVNIDAYDLIWSPDGDRLYLTEYNKLFVYSKNALSQIKGTEATGHIRSLALTRDGNMLAVGFDESISIWETKNWKLLQTITLEYQVNDIAFSKDNRLLVASDSEDILRIWDFGKEEIIHEIEYPKKEINIMAIEFSPDDSMIATGTQDSTRIWNAENWDEIYWAKDKYTQDVLFFHDNSKLAFINKDEINIISLTDFLDLKILKPDDDRDVVSIDLSPNNELLVSGNDAGNIIFWNANNGNKIYQIRPDSWANYIAFSPDGKMIAFKGSRESGVTILGIP